MRLPLILALLTAAATAASAGPALDAAPTVDSVTSSVTTRCANPTTQFARGSAYPGKPLKPEKLTELPPGQTYAAVYRMVDGCAVPVMYREVRAGGQRR